METNRPPAIVQQAQKTCAWYRQQYEENEKKHWAVQDALLANFKESGIWKSEFNTWGAACELLLGISQGRANERILRHKQSSLAQTTSPHADRTNPQDKKEQKALSQVEKARETAPEPEKEEEEKPAVHSADEKPQEEVKPQNNGHVKPAKPPIDVSGCVIPQRLLAIRSRRQEIQDAAYWSSKLKCLFEGLQTKDDALFRHLKASGNLQTFMNGAATMHYTISKCLPDVVCPECGGKSDSCQYCFGSGWISEVTWNREWVKSNDRLKGAEVAKRAKNL